MSSQNIVEKKDKLGKPFKSQRYSISFFKPYQALALFVLGKYECLRTKLQSFVYHRKQTDPQKINKTSISQKRKRRHRPKKFPIRFKI